MRDIMTLDQEVAPAQRTLKRNIPSTELKQGPRAQSWFK